MRNITIDGVEYTPVIKQVNKRITKLLDFEVYPNHMGKMTWDDAKKGCEALGEGWRLPTRIELLLICETKVSTFIGMSYWSSTENHQDYAWAHNLHSGGQSNYSKNVTHYVYPVRDVKQSLTSGTTASTAVLNTTLFGPTS